MVDFVFYSDSGHGWLEVPVSLLKELGIQYDISRYSYLSKCHNYAYLEEDCDYTRFAIAMEKAGRKFSYTEVYKDGDSHIRQYTPYYCLKQETLVSCTVLED